MKTKRINRDSVRENRIVVAVSSDEKHLIFEVAQKRGLTVSALIRVAVLKFCKEGEL